MLQTLPAGPPKTEAGKRIYRLQLSVIQIFALRCHNGSGHQRACFCPSAGKINRNDPEFIPSGEFTGKRLFGSLGFMRDSICKLPVPYYLVM
jgi:hypothetical protein